MTEHQEPDDAYASLYGPHDPAPLDPEAQQAYDDLYKPHEWEPLTGEDRDAYNSVYDWSNVAENRRPEHARQQ